MTTGAIIQGRSRDVRGCAADGLGSAESSRAGRGVGEAMAMVSLSVETGARKWSPPSPGPCPSLKRGPPNGTGDKSWKRGYECPERGLGRPKAGRLERLSKEGPAALGRRGCNPDSIPDVRGDWVVNLPIFCKPLEQATKTSGPGL